MTKTTTPPDLPDGMGRILVSTAGMGTFSFLHSLASPPRYRLLQQMVGGNIELIIDPSGLDPELSIYGYDEARIYNQPQNDAITEWMFDRYRYSMVGTFLILSSNEVGDSPSLNHAESMWLMANYPGLIDWTDHEIARWGELAEIVNG